MVINELFLPDRYRGRDPIGQIAKKHGVSRQRIEHQLLKGIKVEHEHSTDDAVAREIALDHLGEFPDYYDRLQKAEQ